MNLSGFFKAEKKKITEIKGLNNKIQYIWDYYKLWVIGIVAFIVVLIYFLTQLNARNRDYWFYLVLANTMEDVGTGSELYKGYTEYAGFDLSEKDVVFNNQIYFDYLMNVTGNTYFDTFIVYAEAGTLDAVTMETDSLAALGQTGRLMNLDDEAASSLKEKYKDRLIYFETTDEEGNDIEYPVGIDISDSILMERYSIYAGSCGIGLGYKSENIEAVEKFLEYIYAEDDVF